MFIFNDFQLDIADVTNFVHPGSPLDDEASQRGTSVYLVERRIDMLPKPLTEGQPFSCSSSSSSHRLNAFFYIRYCLLLWLIVFGVKLIKFECYLADICSLRADVERLAFSVIWVCVTSLFDHDKTSGSSDFVLLLRNKHFFNK